MKKLWKIVISIILCMVIVTSTVFLFADKNSSNKTVHQDTQITTNISLNVLNSQIHDSNMNSSLIVKLASKLIRGETIPEVLRQIVYTNFSVSLIMSIAYPVVYTNFSEMDILDFQNNLDMAVTPDAFAKKIKDKTYTCFDKNKTKKTFYSVLKSAGNWNYMNNKISIDGNTGVPLWFTVDWGVKDKSSFYAALDDMGDGLKGLLQMLLQGKGKSININLPEYLFGISFFEINYTAAEISPLTDINMYESVIIPMFKKLGLNKKAYSSVEEYESCSRVSQMLENIIEPIIDSFEEESFDLNGIFDNLKSAVNDEKIISALKKIGLKGKFTYLAELTTGKKNGRLFSIEDSMKKTETDIAYNSKSDIRLNIFIKASEKNNQE